MAAVSRRILIVEDDRKGLELLQTLVEPFGSPPPMRVDTVQDNGAGSLVLGLVGTQSERLPIVHTYRTLYLAPPPEMRKLFEQLEGLLQGRLTEFGRPWFRRAAAAARQGT